MLNEILIEDITVRKKNNENNKNSERPLIVVNQNHENRTKFARRALELNQYIDNGNAQLWSFLGATFKQFLHYLDVNLDSSTETVLVYVDVNDILNSDSNISWLLLNKNQGPRHEIKIGGAKNS